MKNPTIKIIPQYTIDAYLKACKDWKEAKTETHEIWASMDKDNWRNCLMQEHGMTYREIEQLEKQTPAMLFVQIVNENEPGTFPTKEQMDEDSIRGDIDTFSNDEGNIPNN